MDTMRDDLRDVFAVARKSGAAMVEKFNALN